MADETNSGSVPAQLSDLLPNGNSPQALPISNTAATPAPQSNQTVNVLNPSGELVSIHSDQLPSALEQGYRQATPEDLTTHIRHEQYGGLGQQALAGVEGVAQGVAGPLATAAEVASGLTTPEAIRERAEEHSGTHTAGVLGGLAGPALLTGGASLAAKAGIGGMGALKAGIAAAEPFTQAGVLNKVGQGALKGLGLAEAATPMAKIGSWAAQMAVENATFQGGEEISKMILKDPDQTAQTAIASVGLAAVLGGALGGGVGGGAELWKATAGKQVKGALGALSRRFGGIEGQAELTPVEKAIQKTGMEFDPAINSRLTGSEKVQHWAKGLEQTDVNKSGLEYQASHNKAQRQLEDVLVESVGRDAKSLSSEPISKYEAGKGIAHSLASEYKEQLDPIANKFNKFRHAYGETPLGGGATLPGSELRTPGTTDMIQEKLAQLAQQEGWLKIPDSDIASNLNKITKSLPKQETLNDLVKFRSAVGDMFQADATNGPMRRAGGLIKNVLKDAEGEVLERAVGAAKGEEALAELREARAAYRQQSELKEALDERLHLRGSTSGYSKALREAGTTDGETILNRLNGKNDAHLLEVMQKNYPKTAELIKQYHVDSLLREAVGKAKGDQTLNAGAFVKALDKMSPEMKAFALPPGAAEQAEAVGTLLNQFSNLPHNFSNTARTLDKLMDGVPGAVVSTISMIAGHNPLISAALGYLTKYVAKDAPDAVRLSLLKFLGSNKPVNSNGFKAMVDFVQNTIKGEQVMTKGVKGVFKAESEVLPERLRPTEKDRIKLDEALKKAQAHPEMIGELHGQSGHYMEEHSQAVTQTTAKAVNYLNSLRPSTDKNLPFDSKKIINPVQQAAYNKALNIAQQPLSVLEHIKKGNLTSQDVITVKTLYPDLYNRMAEKLQHQMIDMANKGEAIPYKNRLALSIFLGRPLDSTMTPMAIQGAQPPPPPQAPTQGMSAPKANNLIKGAETSQTPLQKAESRKTSKK